MRFLLRMPPVWFSPSKAMPAVMEPSPITAMTLVLPARNLAHAIPKPAEMEVPLCPALNASNGLSLRRVNPEMP